MDTLHTGIRCNFVAGLIYSRHRCYAKVNTALARRRNQPGTTDGGVRFAFAEQRIHGRILTLGGHKLHEFLVVFQRLDGVLIIEAGLTIFVQNVTAKCMEPACRIVRCAVLFHKAIMPAFCVLLHIFVQFFCCRRHFIVTHITSVVHIEQRLKVDRKLIHFPFVGSSLNRHRNVLIQGALVNEIRYRCENAHFSVNANFIVGKEVHIRGRIRVVADHLQRIGQTVFLFQFYHDIRGKRIQLCLQRLRDFIFFVVPDRDGNRAICLRSIIRAARRAAGHQQRYRYTYT